MFSVAFQPGAFQPVAFQTGEVVLYPNPCMMVSLEARPFTIYKKCGKTMLAQYFNTMEPGEANVLTFNFSADLLNGNELSGNPTITISTYLGTDSNPTAIQNGSAGFDTTSTMVLVPVLVSLAPVDYLITVSCATQDSSVILVLPGILPVRVPS